MISTHDFLKVTNLSFFLGEVEDHMANLVVAQLLFFGVRESGERHCLVY